MEQHDIETLARLAQIAINETEADYYAKSISKIVHLVDKLSKVETRDIAPLTHPFSHTQPLRPDVITETDQVNQLLANAPQTLANLFLVPQVIES